MVAKLLAFVILALFIAAVVGGVFGYAIMISVGVLNATYGFGTLSFGSSWVLGLCWAILFSTAGLTGR